MGIAIRLLILPGDGLQELTIIATWTHLRANGHGSSGDSIVAALMAMQLC